MKKLIYSLLAVVLFSCNNTNAQKEKKIEKQTNVNVRKDIDSDEENHHSDDSFNGKYESHREVIQKEFTVLPNAFLNVHNIFGDVKVEGYNGNKVIVEVEKIIKAEDKADVELGVKEAKLAFDQIGDTLTFYTSEPYDTRPRKKLSYDWGNDNEKHRRNYIVHLNYTIKVPRSMGLQLSTVNNGKVDASEIDGRIKAYNVNGGITLTNVRAAHDVHSINGNVLINFLASPPENSKFHTLNGKLDITFPKDFSADCEFKSFNGNFYTDFDDIENLPAKTEKQVKNNENGTTYKLNKINSYRFGKGGKNIKIETFNGNAYIRKQS